MSRLSSLKEQIRSAMERGAFDDALEVCREASLLVDPEVFEDWYGVSLSLALCLLEKTPKEAANIEEAKGLYLGILSRLDTDDWSRRSSVLRNLGVLFEERILGSRVDNVREAVAFYEKAAAAIPRRQQPDDWGLMMGAAGLAGSRVAGHDAVLAERARDALHVALTTLSSSSFPDEREEFASALMGLPPRSDPV